MYCTSFGLQWCHYTLIHAFLPLMQVQSQFHLQCLTQKSHPSTVNIHFLRHFDEEVPERLAKSASTRSAVYYKNAVLKVFTPLSLSSSSPPFLSMHNKPCLVHSAGHNVRAQRLPGNGRGCAFGPNYSSQPPPSLHLHLNWFLLLKEENLTPAPNQPLSLAVLGAGGGP